MTTITERTHTIDAAGKTLGRVASEAAKALMGKTLPDYTPNQSSGVRVVISNASKISMRESKAKQTVFTHYSGYPGGLKSETLDRLIARKGHGEALSQAIERMMPRNKLRPIRMKHLTITA